MRILLVEDDIESRDALRRLLQKWGYDVAVAESLQRGLVLLETEHFNAILSDIALPDGTGYALVSEARRRADSVLAIALSAYPYPEDVRVPKLTGFDYHLQKPIDCARLQSLLQMESRRVVVG
jgi:two-component system CheB/CheR fusion protein